MKYRTRILSGIILTILGLAAVLYICTLAGMAP